MYHCHHDVCTSLRKEPNVKNGTINLTRLPSELQPGHKVQLDLIKNDAL
jgi:hypothetical protein